MPQNPEGQHFIVGSGPPVLPWVSECANGIFFNCTLPGIDGELLLALSTILKFTFHVEALQRPENMSEDTSWDEIFVHYLTAGTIDFTMNSMAIQKGFSDTGIDFGSALVYTDRGYMIRKPIRDLKYLLTRPFESEVWWCLFASIGLLTLLCTVVWVRNYLRPHEPSECSFASSTPVQKDQRDPESSTPEANKISSVVCPDTDSCKPLISPIEALLKSFWTVCMVTLQQSLPSSYYLHQRPYSQKFLIAFWIGGSFIIASSYGAMLISVLLDLKTQVFPFTNTDELVDAVRSKGYRLILPYQDQEDFYAWTKLLRTRPAFRDYIHMIDEYPPEIVADFDQMLDRLLADKYLVYPCRLTDVQYRIQNVRCNVTFVRNWDECLPTSPGFRPNFPYLERFSRTFLTLRTAIYQDIRKRYLPDPICDPDVTDMSLSLDQLQGGFLMLCAGGASACVILLAEAFVRVLLSDPVNKNIKRLSLAGTHKEQT